MRIIVTGFVPFPGVEINPSEKIIHRLNVESHPFDFIAEVLPTAFAPAGERIRELIRTHEPEFVLSLGVAAGREAMSIERFALNINDADIPDNDGNLISGQPIVADAPAAYRPTLPIEQLYAVLEAKNIPVEYSNHAGAYVCNHVMYSALHEIDQLGLLTQAGFIHIPMMTEAEGQKGAEDGLPLETMLTAVKACLGVLAGGENQDRVAFLE
ncbi:MAG: hypothetical protein RLP44_12990 [Aggregatilineales bacterium]